MAFVLVPGLAGAPISAEAVSLVMLSGGALVGDDLYRYGVDLIRYLQFWAVVVKLVLLLVALSLPAWGGQAVLFALVIGSVISHAPGRIRQAALIGAPGPCATRACKKSTEPSGELTR
ncbi:MAG: hypothetical protein KC912_19380 [Proteobacteria bacterium]|nr:hypothetical protein [Pseudomonadota bacterium]